MAVERGRMFNHFLRLDRSCGTISIQISFMPAFILRRRVAVGRMMGDILYDIRKQWLRDTVLLGLHKYGSLFAVIGIKYMDPRLGTIVHFRRLGVCLLCCGL